MNSPSRPSLHVVTTANQNHGGFASACGLMSRLRRYFHVTAWPVSGPPPPDNLARLQASADRVGRAGAIPVLGAGDHVLFYMNDYPAFFGNFADQWRTALSGSAGAQMVLNRSLGSLAHQHWLADRVTHIYFHDSWMQHSWGVLTRESPLAGIVTEVLAPPADLSGFRGLADGRPTPPPIVVGRLAGDSDLPRNAMAFYQKLARELPDARFWFMPATPEMAAAFRDDPRFRFLDRGAIPATEFLGGCHIYALTYWRGVPVPGPRSLMEAMAAGCAPVVIDRQGPRDRVVHGESGFRTNDDNTFIRHVADLARDASLRERIARGAEQRSRQWDPEAWVERIVANSLGRHDRVDGTTGAV